MISRVLTEQVELAASPLVGLARVDVLAEAHALREALAESLAQLASHALAEARLAHLLRARALREALRERLRHVVLTERVTGAATIVSIAHVAFSSFASGSWRSRTVLRVHHHAHRNADARETSCMMRNTTNGIVSARSIPLTIIRSA